VIQAIVEGWPEAQVVLVGEKGCQGIIDPHERIFDWCGEINIRHSFILMQYADLVVSPETSVANAASAFDTPKVVILSHSTEENLTKYWRNCTAVYEPVQCFPCHKLHYTKDSCPLEKETQMPLCQALLHPKKLLPPIEQAFRAWTAKQIIRVKG
jgi:ADP-heptose:LPS heptosyltransferase